MAGESMAKLLIVDDSLTVRLDLNKIFCKAGYQVVEAVDGEDAVEKFKEHPDVDLIICDYNLPYLNGLDALAKMYGECGDKKPRALMLTTESSGELKEKGRRLGLTGWILKPYREETLLTGVKKILAK